MTAVVVTRAKSAKKTLSSRVNFYDFKKKSEKHKQNHKKVGENFMYQYYQKI